MGSIFKKATGIVTDNGNVYECYNLKENPFPLNPFLNQESTDKRYNGDSLFRRAERTFGTASDYRRLPLLRRYVQGSPSRGTSDHNKTFGHRTQDKDVRLCKRSYQRAGPH